MSHVLRYMGCAMMRNTPSIFHDQLRIWVCEKSSADILFVRLYLTLVMHRAEQHVSFRESLSEHSVDSLFLN